LSILVNHSIVAVGVINVTVAEVFALRKHIRPLLHVKIVIARAHVTLLDLGHIVVHHTRLGVKVPAQGQELCRCAIGMDTVVIELLALAKGTFCDTAHALTVRCHHLVLLVAMYVL
jgi:hypothetical protein